MKKKLFEDEINSLNKLKTKDDYFKERIIWGKGISISGLKMLPTIYLIIPGIVMLICGFPTMLLGLVVKPFTSFLVRKKINKIKKTYPKEFDDYNVAMAEKEAYYRQYVNQRMMQF